MHPSFIGEVLILNCVHTQTTSSFFVRRVWPIYTAIVSLLLIYWIVCSSPGFTVEKTTFFMVKPGDKAVCGIDCKEDCV